MKRLTALLLAAALLMNLNACGGSRSAASADPVPDDSVSSSAVSDSASDAEETETAEEPENEEEYRSDAAESDHTDYDDEMHAFYALLNDNQKTVYRQIVDAVGQGISEVTPAADVTTDEFSQLSRAVYLDQPQLFWMQNSWSLRYDPDTNIVSSASVDFNSLADDLDANIAAFRAAADEVLSGLDGLTDAEAERTIHDWLVSTVDYASGELDQSAYGALVNHSAVCEGYTRAFQYLMQCAGIPTYTAEGESVDKETGEWVGHAWNIVRLGDGYYNVDVTWDDPIAEGDNYIHYSYYNRTDADLSADHERDDFSSLLPVCDAVGYSFESLYGMPPELGVTMEMGLTREEVIVSLDTFYRIMQEDIISAGTGTHTYSYAISGADVMNGIAAAMDSGEFFDNAIQPAINSFGLNGYSYSCSGSYIDLGGGYYYESLEITIN